MPESLAAAPQSYLLRRATNFRRQDNASKASVIGIAATATVLIVAVIGGLVFWYLRRRKDRGKRDRHGPAGSMDGELNTLQDGASKTPLMDLENQSRDPEDRGSLVPRYHEDDEIPPAAPTVPYRTMSASTVRSLPPSYAVAVRSSPRPRSQNEDETDIPTHHVQRSSSNASRAGGLRPLMLVNAQQSSDGVHETNEESRRPRTPPPEENSNNALSVTPLRHVVRPRASSRFREEDLDI